jgi:hypothetical protein
MLPERTFMRGSRAHSKTRYPRLRGFHETIHARLISIDVREGDGEADPKARG